MLVTMRLASSFITSKFFEGTFLQSSYTPDNVLGGNFKGKSAQNELAGKLFPTYLFEIHHMLMLDRILQAKSLDATHIYPEDYYGSIFDRYQ